MTELHLLKLRQWLTVGEAGAYLSDAMGTTVEGQHILRLGLDGFLTLSLYLPVNTSVKYHHEGADETKAPTAVTRIEGIWDMTMLGSARRQIEHEYHWMANLPFINMDGTPGAWVFSGESRYQLEPTRSSSGFSSRSWSAFPKESVVGVRLTVLNAFAAAHRNVPPAPEAPPDAEKPLGQRERTTLLTIIAAFCHEAGIDVSKPTASAVTIENLTEQLNARIPARTIEDHLRKIPDALERRGKSSA